MRRQLLLIIVSTVGPLILTTALASAQQKQQSKQKQAPSKAQTQSMMGCVDQQDGRYVLIHDQTRSTIVNLEAEGFPDEGFAKHVGHKVTVRGTSSPAGAERPVFRVRSVESVSDNCGPLRHDRE